MARDCHIVYVAIFILMTSARGASKVIVSPPTNPFLNPKDDPYNPLKYIVSNALTAIVFAFVLLIAFIQTFYTLRYGAKWMLAMVIGGYTYAIGFGCRFGLHYHPDSQEIYIVEYLFIVLSPCAFIAANYILLGRITKHISCPMHVLLPIQDLTISFVTSDITTFVVQAIGGGMMVSSDQVWRETGSHIFLVGLVLQLASFALFSGIYIRFLYRVCTLERSIWERDAARPWHRDWRTLAAALAISCASILVRSCYRVAELSQGLVGYLATTEVFSYAFDTLPLVVAISAYVLFWPGWLIKDGAKTVHDGPKSSESLQRILP